MQTSEAGGSEPQSEPLDADAKRVSALASAPARVSAAGSANGEVAGSGPVNQEEEKAAEPSPTPGLGEGGESEQAGGAAGGTA